MARIVKWVLFGLLLGPLFGATMHAATRTAASCNASDVQTAMNAAQSGDTVAIPAGTCTWTTSVSWTAPANVILQGAGSQSMTGGGDITVIIDNVSHSPSDNPTLQVTTGTSSTTFRMSGITFESNGSSSASYGGSVRIFGNSALVRVDHSHLDLTADGKQMTVSGCVYGVMDHSIVDLSAGSTNNGIFLDQGSCGGDSLGVGNGQWNEATTLGSANYFYFENDIFNGGTQGSSEVVPFVNDCSGGGRFVFRYNTINGLTVQGHGTGHSNNPPDRGCRAYEIYGNTFTGGSVAWPVFNAFYNTGGTGVIWGNTATGYYQYFITGHINRASDSTYTQSAPPNGWGYCSSSSIGGVPGPSNWDHNTSGQNGYACLDQIGRGAGDLLQGLFPNVCDASSLDCTNGIYTGRWPNQALEPVYEWSDTWNTVPGWPSSFWNEYDAQAQQNRDYYLNNAGFNGTAGVGSGLLAARPSTCTPYVAYWATDTNTLYQCSARNTWTAHYTPYTYPHPLVQGGGPPGPPTNLQAIPQ